MNLEIAGRKFALSKKIVATFLTIVVLVIGAAGYFIMKGNNDIIINLEDGASDMAANRTATKGMAANGTATKGAATKGADNSTVNSGTAGVSLESAATNAANNTNIDSSGQNELAGEDMINIYVVGCVKNPGIVQLKKGQLIDDAIKKAGGATSDADLNTINLVYKLNENLMLNILPKAGTGAATKATTGTGTGAGTGATTKATTNVSSKTAATTNASNASQEAGAGVLITRDSGGSVVNETMEKTNAKVNINTATAAELDTLPGIGEATAGDIIDYREKNGAYKQIQDIMKVTGIKESKFNKIKDHITVE